MQQYKGNTKRMNAESIFTRKYLQQMFATVYVKKVMLQDFSKNHITP
jgi:hypothetical protein